jgi:hypothetical protein
VGCRIFLGQPLLLPAALSALIWLGRKYSYTNVLTAAVVRITCINPTTLDAYDNTLLLVNGVCVQTDADRAPPRALLQPCGAGT